MISGIEKGCIGNEWVNIEIDINSDKGKMKYKTKVKEISLIFLWKIVGGDGLREMWKKQKN